MTTDSMHYFGIVAKIDGMFFWANGRSGLSKDAAKQDAVDAVVCLVGNFGKSGGFKSEVSARKKMFASLKAASGERETQSVDYDCGIAFDQTIEQVAAGWREKYALTNA